MLGDMFLIKPIFYKKIKNVDVYFPKNSTWKHVFTNEIYNGGGVNVTVSSPIGTPAVFIREDRDPSLKSTIAGRDVSRLMKTWWEEQ